MNTNDVDEFWVDSTISDTGKPVGRIELGELRGFRRWKFVAISIVADLAVFVLAVPTLLSVSNHLQSLLKS